MALKLSSTIHFMVMTLAVYNVLAEEYETNEVSTPPKVNLDGNLRRALLKALTELENDEQANSGNQLGDNPKDKLIERASASSVSIYANSDLVSSSPPPIETTASTTTTTTEKSLVFLQKSEGIQHPSIITIEKDSEDSEQIITSSSNNFANQPFQSSNQDEKVQSSNLNSIKNSDKEVTKLRRVELTTITPTVSTEESEAKVEDVQFFSAPLVAAFTVHQDELGQPNKVEPIYRSTLANHDQVINTVEQERIALAQQKQIRLVQLEQERLKLEELRRQQLKIQQYQQEQKQKALEQEIYRLNLSLKQQEQIHLRQQEELRKRANAQPFSIANSGFISNGIVLNQQPPSKPSQQFNSGIVSVQPSLTFDPLVEAGKLPLNAQVLPIREPVEFRSSFVNNFNQKPQNNRFFRQNTGTGNFGVNDFKNSNTFSVQQSFQPSFGSFERNNGFFRSNGESALTVPQFVQLSSGKLPK
nr:reticulocyte-binding protein 2 homolog a-like [Leptinotarsa decemlineata]